jgi:D-psicose/D-tagatose/L-ribulose 3-epimerase
MSHRFRHAICNEVFEKWGFADTCRAIRKAGYEGIEIAPFTLAEDPAEITRTQRQEYRATMQGEGLRFAGLHWLMVSPPGLHVTTPDPALRAKSWEHIRHLIDLCSDMGEGGIMVFGSPKQRSTVRGTNAEDATRRFVDGLKETAPHAESMGVTILIEALPPTACDVVTSLDEAAKLVKEIGSPAVQSMFDSHNAAEEEEPHDVLVERHAALIRHVHVNEMDGRHPGTGSYDFKPVLKALRRNNYQGWISLEVFDFSLGAEKIAADSLRYLEAEIEKLGHD